MYSFSHKTLITFITSLLTFGLDLIALAIVSRFLGPEGKGIYSLTILIPSIFLIFGNFGIGAANVFYIGSGKYKIEDIVSNSIICSLFIGLGFILIFSILFHVDFFDRFIEMEKIYPIYLWLIVLATPIILLSGFFQNILRGREDIVKYNKVSIFQTALQLIATVIFVAVLKEYVFGALLAYVAAIFTGFIVSAYYVRKISKFHLFLNIKLLKDSVVYGSKIFLANAVSFLNYRLDMLLIAIYLNSYLLGIYSIAVGMAEKLFIVPGALAVVLFPRISSLKETDANEFTSRVVRHTFFVMIVSSVFLSIFIRPVIYVLFGPAFLPAFWPLVILLPGIIAFGIGGVLAADLSGRGKPQYAVYSSTACLVINIILNIILIPKWGINGAAFASAVGYWADTAVILWAFRKLSKKSLFEFLIIKKSDFKDYADLLMSLKNNFLKYKKV